MTFAMLIKQSKILLSQWQRIQSWLICVINIMVTLYINVNRHHSLYRQLNRNTCMFEFVDKDMRKTLGLFVECLWKPNGGYCIFTGARILPVNLISTVMLYISHPTYDIPWIVCLPSCVMSPQSDNHSVQASTTTDQFWVFWAGSSLTGEEQENMCYWQERMKKSFPIIVTLWQCNSENGSQIGRNYFKQSAV